MLDITFAKVRFRQTADLQALGFTLSIEIDFDGMSM